MRNPVPIRAVLAVAVLGLAAPATAQTFQHEEWLSGALATRFGERDQWRVVMGVGAGVAPEFRGADDYEGKPLPLLDVEWRGAYFLSTQRGMGVNLVSQSSTRAGPRFTFDLGRDSSDSEALKGLADVDSTVEFGLFAQHYENAWRFQADLRTGLNGHEGVVGSVDVALGGAFAERVSLIVGANLSAADETYMKAYFGVPSGPAGNPPAFRPRSGIRDVTGYATIVYAITDNLFATLDARASQFLEDAASSPVSISDHQFFLGTVLAYQF